MDLARSTLAGGIEPNRDVRYGSRKIRRWISEDPSAVAVVGQLCSGGVHLRLRNEAQREGGNEGGVAHLVYLPFQLVSEGRSVENDGALSGGVTGFGAVFTTGIGAITVPSDPWSQVVDPSSSNASMGGSMDHHVVDLFTIRARFRG